MRSLLIAETVNAEDRRKTRRHVTTRKVSKLVRNCGDELCILRNLSTHGAKADVTKIYHVNEKVLLHLRRNEFVGARVAWVGSKSIGMEFYDPIAHDVVLANLCDEEKRAGGPRVEILTNATMLLGTDRHDVLVGDLSQKGARLLGNHKLRSGHLICLELGSIGPIPAEVRWSDATKAGILFNDPLALWDMLRCIKTSNRGAAALPGMKIEIP